MSHSEEFNNWFQGLVDIAADHGVHLPDQEEWEVEFLEGLDPEEVFYDEYPDLRPG